MIGDGVVCGGVEKAVGKGDYLRLKNNYQGLWIMEDGSPISAQHFFVAENVRKKCPYYNGTKVTLKKIKIQLR